MNKITSNEVPLQKQLDPPIDLAKYLDDIVTIQPNICSVVDSDESKLSYGELSAAADKIASFLYRKGVVVGDKVGLFMHKSANSLAAIFGILRLGATYVPIDAGSSATRAYSMFHNCDVGIILTNSELAKKLTQTAPLLVPNLVVILSDPNQAKDMNEDYQILDMLIENKKYYPRSAPDPNRLAYILHTSGSSGTPKGVAISHSNAVSFVEWASNFFNVTANDQVSSHAPFHFDLSIFDIYVSVKNGACIHLIDTDLAASPRHLISFISTRKITIWYSTPAILTILAKQNSERRSVPNQLRLVLFAGEVMPIKTLLTLRSIWPEPVYYNLYGPTETNVCTVYRVPTYIPANYNSSLPIGHPCSHCDTIVVDEHLRHIQDKPGMLCVAGPSVITRYWNSPTEIDRRTFNLYGKRWYNTGDRVSLSTEGYIFLGRVDRMIKRYGYRIELEEIESCLTLHPKVTACAVVNFEREKNMFITAFLEAKDSQASITELRTFCYERLAHYMLPDYFRYLPDIPRTSTGKTNYQLLELQCQTELINNK